MRAASLFIASLALALASAGACAQSAVATEGDLKAAYIYHFIQFTQWPDSAFAHASEISICIEENNPLLRPLRAIAGKNIRGKPIAITVIAGGNATACQVRLLGRGDSVPAEPAPGTREPVLSVTDESALQDAATIVLRVRGDRVIFDVNRAQAQKAGLEISSKLLRLAETVQ